MDGGVCVFIFVSTLYTEDMKQSLQATNQIYPALFLWAHTQKHTHTHTLFAFVYARQQMAAHYWADRAVIWQAPCYPSSPLSLSLLSPILPEDTQHNTARIGHF